MRRASLVLASLLVACSGGSGDPDAAGADANTTDAPGSPDATVDAVPPIDAYMPNLDCLGATLPDTADDPLTIDGNTFDPGVPGFIDPAQLSDVTVTAFAYGDETTALDSDVSAATTGLFSLSTVTGGNPSNSYLRARQEVANPSHITTYV